MHALESNENRENKAAPAAAIFWTLLIVLSFYIIFVNKIQGSQNNKLNDNADLKIKMGPFFLIN